MRSVALGLWVRTGSRNETPAQAGVSHFLEHLLFKGTEKYSAIEFSDLTAGRITVRPEGFGFVLVQGGEDLFVPRSGMHGSGD